MQIFILRPKTLDSPDWTLSSSTVPHRVHAENEVLARLSLARELWVSNASDTNEDIRSSPWMDGILVAGSVDQTASPEDYADGQIEREANLSSRTGWRIIRAGIKMPIQRTPDHRLFAEPGILNVTGGDAEMRVTASATADASVSALIRPAITDETVAAVVRDKFEVLAALEVIRQYLEEDFGPSGVSTQQRNAPTRGLLDAIEADQRDKLKNYPSTLDRMKARIDTETVTIEDLDQFRTSSVDLLEVFKRAAAKSAGTAAGTSGVTAAIGIVSLAIVGLLERMLLLSGEIASLLPSVF